MCAAAAWCAALAATALADDCTAHWDNAIGQPGMSHTVFALTVYNGDLIAGGQFGTAGGQTYNRIARWDGSAWHPFESNGAVGVSHGGGVGALTGHNGDLIVGGAFMTAGGQTMNRLNPELNCGATI